MSQNLSEVRNILLGTLKRIKNLEDKYENINKNQIDNNRLLDLIFNLKKEQTAEYLKTDYLSDNFTNESLNRNNHFVYNREDQEVNKDEEIVIPPDFFKI